MSEFYPLLAGGEFEEGADQKLVESVVNVAGNALALLFLCVHRFFKCRLQIGSLTAELFPRPLTVWATEASDDALAVARANLAGMGRAAVAVRMEAGSWYDRELLEQLDSTSVRIVLGEGEKKVEHVKIR